MGRNIRVKKQDAANAINILMDRGLIDPEATYDFLGPKGHEVRIWIDNGMGGPVKGVALVDPVELIVGAGRLRVVRYEDIE